MTTDDLARVKARFLNPQIGDTFSIVGSKMNHMGFIDHITVNGYAYHPETGEDYVCYTIRPFQGEVREVSLKCDRLSEIEVLSWDNDPEA